MRFAFLVLAMTSIIIAINQRVEYGAAHPLFVFLAIWGVLALPFVLPRKEKIRARD